jgi:hypothetical protein
MINLMRYGYGCRMDEEVRVLMGREVGEDLFCGWDGGIL